MFSVTPPFGAVHSSPEMMLISLFFVRAGTWWSPRSSTFAVIMLMPLTNWIRLVYREAYPAGLGRARLRLRLQVCMHMPILYTEFPSRNNLPPDYRQRWWSKKVPRVLSIRFALHYLFAESCRNRTPTSCFWWDWNWCDCKMEQKTGAEIEPNRGR